jgi:hypothetical protein
MECERLQVCEQELRLSSEIERRRLNVLVEELRMKLEETLKTKEDLVAIVDGIGCSSENEELSVIPTDRSSEVSAYQAMKIKVDHLEDKNTHLVMVCVKQRNELFELKKQHEQMKQGSALCRRVMEELKENISILSNANNAQSSELDEIRQKLIAHNAAREGTQANERNTKRAVLKAFGWKQETADPTLVRAACGFWNATAECMDCGDSRASLKRRMDMWITLTSEGFNGRVIEVMENKILESKKFNVVEICRKSDVDSQFNGRALKSVSDCEPGKKKYARGLLCSDTTLRRTQDKVHLLAKRLGFSSLPNEEHGNVWCWGDSNGNFVTGVNRYVYEIYVKARCVLATKDKPWIVPLTGDLARVNYRGKAITMAGPKQADPRLPCQQGTMKSSNQSRNLYTPAVAGYVNESYVMKYFDEMVAAFVEIEQRGYCVVDGIQYPVHIDVIVVADMAYLHKYLKRGGGSHACTNFCFLCSINKKYRQAGYPGGCYKCRLKRQVYDEATGVQKCRHHDVCDADFLKWQKERLQYLLENVAPRIPKTALPFYENMEGLRKECLQRCSNNKERNEVQKKKSVAQLEKWLRVDGRTRGKHLLYMCLKSVF